MYKIFFGVFIAIIGRLIPHLPNMTPIINVNLWLGKQLSNGWTILAVLLTMFFSDVILALSKGYPILGDWMWFSYSGMVFIALLGKRLDFFERWPLFFCYVLSAGFAYWVWTNFGVWVFHDYYSKSLSGLLACYVAALPFLRNQLIGDMMWFVVIFGLNEIRINHFSLISERAKKLFN